MTSFADFTQHHIALSRILNGCPTCKIKENIVTTDYWIIDADLTNPGGVVWVQGKLYPIENGEKGEEGTKEVITIGGCVQRAKPANRVDGLFRDDFALATEYLQLLLKNERMTEAEMNDGSNKYHESFGFFE